MPPTIKQENRKLGSAGVVWLLTTLSHSLYIVYPVKKVLYIEYEGTVKFENDWQHTVVHKS